MQYCRVYVGECRTEKHFYVGRTFSQPVKRHEAHACPDKGGQGSFWCKKHGYKGMRICVRVLPEQSKQLENDLTKVMMALYGWRAVRGGDYTCTNPDPNDLWWLPYEFRTGSVEKLTTDTTWSRHPRELESLVNRFRASASAKHPFELDTETFA